MSGVWLIGLAAALAGPTPAAERLCQAGEMEALAGRWDTAALYFEQAHRADPRWVRPWLGLGRAALEQGALAEAASWYDGLAMVGADPSRTAAALAECIGREQAAAVPTGTCRDYLAARALGGGGLSALEAVVAAAPGLAPAWADLVPLRPAGPARTEAIRSGLGADPAAGTFGVLVVQLQAAGVRGD